MNAALWLRSVDGGSIRMKPPRGAVGVVLVLPDRHAPLHLVDDPTACSKCGVAMIGADTHPHREIADRERADPMDAADLAHAKPFDRVGEDRLSFAECERPVCLIVELKHGLAVVVIAHPAFKAD